MTYAYQAHASQELQLYLAANTASSHPLQLQLHKQCLYTSDCFGCKPALRPL